MQRFDDITFRSAGKADVPAVVALVESAYRGQTSRAGWTTEADVLDGQRIDPEGVLDVIAKPDSRVLLAEHEDVLLACVHIEKQGTDGYFGMFAVVPTLQNAGIGRQVLAEAERQAANDFGCRRMRMTVIDLREELIAWYERRGYRRTGQHAPFPYGQDRFGLPKRDDLRFEWLEKPLGREHAA